MLKTKLILTIAVLALITGCTQKKEKVDFMNKDLENYIGSLEKEYDSIPKARKDSLAKMTAFIENAVKEKKPALVTFICTHNSRRSHMAQLWAQVAAYYYGIPGVECYSGGLESTAFNPRAVKAVGRAGFKIVRLNEDLNTLYNVIYADDANPVKAFSKKYDDKFNPKKGFLAVMTCSNADKNCPVVAGAAMRLSLPYEDPKNYDDTAEEETKYDECNRNIAREMVYAFSRVKK